MTRTAPVSWDWSTAFAVAGLAATSAGDDGRDEAEAVVQLVDADNGAVAFARMDDSVDVAARVARVVRRGRRGQAARSWEQTRRPEGLRWFRPVDLELPRFPVDDKGMARLTVGRSILFLHDVLGYTELDFEALDPSVHLALTDRYEGRLVGYDHHTLCVDPAQNAQALLTALSRADGPITMDVVALGRGGLVARHLVERTAHLTDGRLTVNSVVAIGTPHLGVDLAGSDRLLTWINRVISLDGPSDLAGGVAAILAHVLGSSADVLHGMSAEPVTPPTGVPWRCIAGTDPRTAGDGRWSAVARWVADPALDDEPNDRFVTVRSALPEGASGVEVAARHDVLVASAELTDELRTRYVDAPPIAPSVRTDGIIVHRGARDIGASWVATDVGAPTDDRPLPPLLTVCLQHGSLEHVDDPVLVGHFAGSPLSGAEERLDDCLDHRLSRAQVARDYPDAYGEFRHFPGDHRRRPGGAIVMGLGPVGDLTSSRLTTVVTRSVIRYASEARDVERLQRGGRADRWAEPLELGLSSVLIGTSRSSGLTVEASIRAIIAGVVAANLRLRPLAAGGGASVGAVAVTRLRFVERYEDVVELTARALDQLANEDRRSTGGPPVEYDPVPAMSEGAAGANAPSDTANDVWTRVSVSQEPPDVDGLSQLTYSMMARQARAEEITHRVDQALVDSIVAQSIDRSADPRIGATLYELLLPHDLKQPLGAGSHLQLLVGDTAADYPWELLTPRDEAFRDGRPLSLTAGVLRQFVERTNIRQGPTRAAERSVLVIGNPPAGPDLPSLWGAAAEAVEVRRAFECATDPKWNVTARIWDGRGEYTGTPMDDDVTPDPAENLVHELMNGSWRVVHVAAHGTNDTSGDATTTSGVVLSQRFHLAPATIGQLSVVPDLVVVNACHLGAIARQLTGMNKVAASFARRLMQIGVRAVIVAGWAIDDDAAATFAETLYRELLDGRELGDALFSARSDVHGKHPDSLTWGAYQCYGDPGFRLAPRGQGRRLGGPSLTVSELRRKIRAAAGTVSDRRSSISAFRREVAAVSEAASQFEGVEADLRATLEQLEGEDLFVDAKPVVRADLDAELAAAWAELGRFDRAVQHYEAALAGGGRNVPVTAIEQLANLSMRHAKELSPGPHRRRLVANAKRYLTALDAFGETPERLALWASFYKKRATMATPPDRDDIDLAAEKYQTASNDPSAGGYHHLNARQLTAISNHYAGRPVAVATKRKRPDDEPPTDFWERNAIGDEMLTALVEEALSGAGLPERATKREVTRMVDAYRDAFLLRSSAANRRSVVDHIEDLADLLPDVPVRGELRSAVTRLRAMEQPAAGTDDAPPSADQGATG